MKRTNYHTPDITVITCDTTKILMGSQFTSGNDQQNITPTDEEFSGEFQSRRKDVWADEENEEDF